MAEDGCNRDDGVSLQLYTAYDSFDPDIRYALETIKVIAPLYIVTVAPDKQPPPDFVNGASRPVTEHLANDPI
jgi:hypothetical protein